MERREYKRVVARLEAVVRSYMEGNEVRKSPRRVGRGERRRCERLAYKGDDGGGHTTGMAGYENESETSKRSDRKGGWTSWG